MLDQVLDELHDVTRGNRKEKVDDVDRMAWMAKQYSPGPSMISELWEQPEADMKGHLEQHPEKAQVLIENLVAGQEWVSGWAGFEFPREAMRQFFVHLTNIGVIDKVKLPHVVWTKIADMTPCCQGMLCNLATNTGDDGCVFGPIEGRMSEEAQDANKHFVGKYTTAQKGVKMSKETSLEFAKKTQGGW